MSELRLTHIGGPTLLLEMHGWRLLTDPTFDPPGHRYNFGWGTSSRKLVGPAVPMDEIGPVDAVLLTHDHHGDNLDNAGRALLASTGTVITTASGARRLGGGAVGLRPWDTTALPGGGRPPIEVTATPARHGPPLSRPIVGDVVGFALAWPGQRDGALWITGDTVWFDGLRRAAKRLRVGTLVMHLGGVQFPLTGPLRYTMTGTQAVRLCRLARPRTAVPVHYEGWRHFRQGRAGAERAFATAPTGVRNAVRWLTIGEPTTMED
jgi:L-ascorbate metabolism protein UlaG (beta-lactamase superfamily)